MDILNNIYVAQGVGFLALIFGVISLSHHRDNHLKGWLAVQSFTLSIHYALMDAYAGAVVTMISALRNYLSIRGSVNPAAFAFLALYVVFGLSRYEVWYDLLPMIASCSSTLAIFYLKGLHMRIVMFCAAFMYFLFNIFVGSIGPMIMEAMMMGANLRTMRKMRKIT